jgi:hypothetical protein
MRLALAVVALASTFAVRAAHAADCTAVAADATVALPASSVASADSGDAAYLFNPRGCHRFVTDFTATLGRPALFYATTTSGGTPDDGPDQCHQAVLDVDAWGWVPGKVIGQWFLPGHWEYIGGSERPGAWSEDRDGYCSLYAPIFNTSASKYTTVRLASVYYDGPDVLRVINASQLP